MICQQGESGETGPSGIGGEPGKKVKNLNLRFYRILSCHINTLLKLCNCL